MVFYFTGTGNSLYVAKKLDDVRLSIPQIIHDDNKVYKADRIGIVCPIYGHEMPEIVKRFLKRTEFHADYFYLVLTYGRMHGGASEFAEQYLMECGIEAAYINIVKMVDNYLPTFDMNEQLALDPEKKVDEHIRKIQEDIDSNKIWKQEVTQADRAWHKRYLNMRKENPIDIKGGIFRVLDYCIGCGICMRVCPTGSIQVKNQHAHYIDTSNCQMCLACVQHCPENAIRLTIPEKNPLARYHNGNIRLSEIVEANNQEKYKGSSENAGITPDIFWEVQSSQKFMN